MKKIEDKYPLWVDKYPLWVEIQKQTENFKDVVDLEGLFVPVDNPMVSSVIHTILVRHRNYFIHSVKAPLMKKLVDLGSKKLSWLRAIKLVIGVAQEIKKYPVCTRENTKYKNTHTTLDIIDKFFGLLNNKGRKSLFDASFRLILPEFEHDGDYSSIRDWWIEEILIAILDGRWSPRPEGWPPSSRWNETEPYGGRHSIVAKMIAKREEIKKLLGVVVNE